MPHAKRAMAFAVLMALCLSMVACNSKTDPLLGTVGENSVTPLSVTADFPDIEVTFVLQQGSSDIDGIRGHLHFSNAGVVAEGGGFSVAGNRVTITEGGNYLIDGETLEGNIVIDTPKTDTVVLYLNGLSLSCATTAPLYLKQAKKLVVELVEGSANLLENTGGFVSWDENNIDGAVFAKEDLILQGEGALWIKSPMGHGIVGKDDVKIKSGCYKIVSASHGISAKDDLEILGGQLTVKSGKDGVKAKHDEDAEKGNILLQNVCLKIIAEGDGISASGSLRIESGQYDITTAGGAGERTEVSAKGIKASADMQITGGIFLFDTADDALHSNGSLTVSGGDMTIDTGDDGMHADETLTVLGGVVFIRQSYEGLEGQHVLISGGEIAITSSDDGINAAGGEKQSDFGGMENGRFEMGGMFGKGEGSSNCTLTVTGGKIFVNAGGDGVDSNGSLSVSGGELYISGPVDNDNGALDHDGEAIISGGIVVAVGSAGMAENFGSQSTQGSVLLNVGQQAAGSMVAVYDRKGQLLVSFTPEKSYSSVVVSTPALTKGESYTVKAGTFEQSLTLSSLIYGSGMGGNMGGMPGMGGMGGGRPFGKK